MGFWSALFGSEETTNYVVKEDGNVIQTDFKKGGKTEVYYYDKNAKYENDPYGRNHNHAAFKNGRMSYLRDDHGNGHNYDKDWDKDDNSSRSSGLCYIATATLQGREPVEVLEPLKQWRYDVLEKWGFGNKLSNYYRRTAPPIAKEVSQMPFIGAVLRNLLVKPAVILSQRPPSLMRDAALLCLFLVGLSIAEVIKFTKNL